MKYQKRKGLYNCSFAFVCFMWIFHSSNQMRDYSIDRTARQTVGILGDSIGRRKKRGKEAGVIRSIPIHRLFLCSLFCVCG
jgi:hypothetical protein